MAESFEHGPGYRAQSGVAPPLGKVTAQGRALTPGFKQINSQFPALASLASSWMHAVITTPASASASYPHCMDPTGLPCFHLTLMSQSASAHPLQLLTWVVGTAKLGTSTYSMLVDFQEYGVHPPGWLPDQICHTETHTSFFLFQN